MVKSDVGEFLVGLVASHVVACRIPHWLVLLFFLVASAKAMQTSNGTL